MPTHSEMINEISRDLSEPFTRDQLINAIVERYGHVRSINIQSLGTDITGCCVNLKSHRSLPGLPLILVSLGRGKYRRYYPSTDQRLRGLLPPVRGLPVQQAEGGAPPGPQEGDRRDERGDEGRGPRRLDGKDQAETYAEEKQHRESQAGLVGLQPTHP